MPEGKMSQTKEKIEHLVDKYNTVLKSGKTKKYTEEETKKDFILPLFEALGWEIYDRNEVSAEEQILSSGRVDYGFYLNDRVKFYLEAKKLSADLHQEEFANQAVKYSFNKGVTWAVLTDFESLEVFNAQDIERNLSDKLFFEISYREFIERFDQLWLLSKEAFAEDLLDKEGEKYGKKLQKISVDETLYKDLNKCREILTKELSIWNDKLKKDKELLDEGVQKLLDRIIFSRVAEDRGIEPPTLIPLIRQWYAGGQKKHLYESMVDKFREFDKIYNSNIFASHPFENWEEYGGATEKVVNTFYGKKGYYEYDFKAMPADVLGSVYENYLGYKLAQSAKGLSLGKDATKRKEQGIYYTPTYIVDYIVKNSLGPVLDKCKSIHDLKKIKVLDPACGSGSFLVKALEVINDKYKEFGAKGDELTKLQILTENIYGVDLDEQAVEIARLNLLINALDQQMKLPPLDKNIKNGNSLISGTDEELKKYFGKNFNNKKPFNWQEEFPEVFREGGFDVIIGNPPWGANIDEDSKFLADKYPNSTKEYKDIYKIFIDEAISLLKPSGNLGFIVPNTFLYQPRYSDVKEIIVNYKHNVINLGERIFPKVQLPSCILILSKQPGEQELVVDFTREDRNILPTKISQINYLQEKLKKDLGKKIIKNTGLIFDNVFLLKDAGVKHQRVNIGKSKKGNGDLREKIYYSGKQLNPLDHPLLIGSDINRYVTYRNPHFFLRTGYKKTLDKNEIVYFDEKIMKSKYKIVWRQTSDKIRASIVGDVWFANTLQAAIIKNDFENKVNLFYALTIFNSKYIDYLYKQKVLEVGKVFPQVKLKYLRDLPFVVGTRDQQENLALKAKRMSKLCEELNRLEENSNKWLSIKSEIEKTDKKIDEEVYKLYGLTPEEIATVGGEDGK